MTRRLATVSEDVARSIATMSEEQQAALQRVTSDSRQAVGEVEEELRAFMGEQRVFCGFLDAEQKSYHELMRQEVSALSRLVDSTLRHDAAPLRVYAEDEPDFLSA